VVFSRRQGHLGGPRKFWAQEGGPSLFSVPSFWKAFGQAGHVLPPVTEGPPGGAGQMRRPSRNETEEVLFPWVWAGTLRFREAVFVFPTPDAVSALFVQRVRCDFFRGVGRPFPLRWGSAGPPSPAGPVLQAPGLASLVKRLCGFPHVLSMPCFPPTQPGGLIVFLFRYSTPPYAREKKSPLWPGRKPF